MTCARHDLDLDAVALQGLHVGRRVVRIDGDYGKLQLGEPHRHVAAVHPRRLQRGDRHVRRRRRHVAHDPIDQGGVGVGGKHASNQRTGRPLEVDAEGSERLLDLFETPPRSQLLVGVDPDQPVHALRKPARRLDDDVASHRVADEHDPLEAELVRHRRHVAAERFDRPGLATETGLPVAAEVDGHDLVRPRERRDLLPPIASVARPAVHENEGGRPRAVGLVRNLDAVASGDGLSHDARALFVAPPKQRYERYRETT